MQVFCGGETRGQASVQAKADSHPIAGQLIDAGDRAPGVRALLAGQRQALGGVRFVDQVGPAISLLAIESHYVGARVEFQRDFLGSKSWHRLTIEFRAHGFPEPFDHDFFTTSRAADSIEDGEARSLAPRAPSSANRRAPGNKLASNEPTAVL